MNGKNRLRNFAAGAFFVAAVLILFFLLVIDAIMFLKKGEIHSLFETLTKVAIGNFFGNFSTMVAFYFGEPTTKISKESLIKILNDDDSQNEEDSEE